MNLKEQLEIIRGEPIQVFEGEPMDIPCIETSDAEKLCKNPVVSVHMITYNHEPYIRQAIEGVMMQKIDFEFELIIGEDASQDKTREICFEYQKKYPDKIRVLWWHENVSKLGGNSRRVFSRCRGEFIAFCEGDDYWTDPLKLQKQVEFLKENSAYSAVADGGNILVMDSGFIRPFNTEKSHDVTIPELIVRRRFPTSGVLLRANYIIDFLKSARFSLDTIVWCYWTSRGRFRYTGNNTSVYRRGMQGVTLNTPRLQWVQKNELWKLELYRLFYNQVSERLIKKCICEEYINAIIYLWSKGQLCDGCKAYKRASYYYPLRTFFRVAYYVILGRSVKFACRVLKRLFRKIINYYN